MTTGPASLRAWLPLALGCAAVWAPSSARADSHRTSSLSWVELPGAEACGGAPAIARAVEERLGRRAIVSPSEAEVSIEARAERSGHPALWHAVVQLRDPDGRLLGSREFNSAADDCSELRSTVALAMALMIDPDAVLRARTEPPAASAPPAAVNPPPAPEPPPPPPTPPPQVIVQRVEVPVPVAAAPLVPSPWRVEPSAASALGFGFLPSIATGVRVGVTVRPPTFWAIEAFGGAWADQTVPAAQGAQVRFSLADAGLAVCPLRAGQAPKVSLSACGGFEVALLQAESEGFPSPRSSVDPALRIVAPARLTFPIAGPFAVRIAGELGVTVLRNYFTYDVASQTNQVLVQSALATAEGEVGLLVSLP